MKIVGQEQVEVTSWGQVKKWLTPQTLHVKTVVGESPSLSFNVRFIRQTHYSHKSKCEGNYLHVVKDAHHLYLSPYCVKKFLFLQHLTCNSLPEELAALRNNTSLK